MMGEYVQLSGVWPMSAPMRLFRLVPNLAPAPLHHASSQHEQWASSRTFGNCSGKGQRWENREVTLRRESGDKEKTRGVTTREGDERR